MAKYTVTINKIVTQETQIFVNAKDSVEAEKVARAMFHGKELKALKFPTLTKQLVTSAYASGISADKNTKNFRCEPEKLIEVQSPESKRGLAIKAWNKGETHDNYNNTKSYTKADAKALGMKWVLIHYTQSEAVLLEIK